MIECKLGAHKAFYWDCSQQKRGDHLLTTNSQSSLLPVSKSLKLRTSNPSWHVDKTTRWDDLRPAISNGAKNSTIKAEKFPAYFFFWQKSSSNPISICLTNNNDMIKIWDEKWWKMIARG